MRQKSGVWINLVYRSFSLVRQKREVRQYVKLDIGSTHSAPSESDVATKSNLFSKIRQMKSKASEPGLTRSETLARQANETY